MACPQLPLLLIALAAATYFLYTQITMNARRRRRKGKIPVILLEINIPAILWIYQYSCRHSSLLNIVLENFCHPFGYLKITTIILDTWKFLPSYWILENCCYPIGYLKICCHLKGTQDWDFFWLRLWNLYYFFISYVKILRFYKKIFLIRPLLGEIRFFRLVWD